MSFEDERTVELCAHGIPMPDICDRCNKVINLRRDDPVNHPKHYCQGEIECIDAIKSALTDEEFRGFCKGTSLAYIWRERSKGGDEDLRKAAWYLARLVKP